MPSISLDLGLKQKENKVMTQYIDKNRVEEILRILWKKDDGHNAEHRICYNKALQEVQCELDTLEVKDPYEECIQYDSIKAGIQAHAETYSFNIESELFNQLTKEQQALWRKEIEQACVSGGDAGYLLARDPRYKENLEVKEVDLYNNGWIDCSRQMPKETKQWSDTLQGHREWTESDMVLAWDSIYGCRIDATKNGKWMSEQRGGYTGQIVHGIIAWRPIPEFNEELL